MWTKNTNILHLSESLSFYTNSKVMSRLLVTEHYVTEKVEETVSLSMIPSLSLSSEISAILIITLSSGNCFSITLNAIFTMPFAMHQMF